MDNPSSKQSTSISRPASTPGTAPPEPAKFRSPAPVRPIVIAFGRLGDMVMLTAVFPLLHHRFGKPCRVIAAGPWNSSLYNGHPHVDGVSLVERHLPVLLSGSWWRVIWQLRKTSVDPIYILERQPRQLARIRQMLALAGVDAARCLFLDDLGSEEHWIDRFLSICRQTPAAVNARNYPLWSESGTAPCLYVSSSETIEIDAYLERRGWQNRKRILIQPGNFRSMSKHRKRWQRSNADDKAWPLDNWANLIHRILAVVPDAVIILCGALEEVPLLEQIRHATKGARVATAELPLRQLLALSATAHSMISVDTGPAHVAAAMSLPVLVLFGAQAQRHWLPRAPRGSRVMGVGGPPGSTRVDEILVVEVFKAWRKLVGSDW